MQIASLINVFFFIAPDEKSSVVLVECKRGFLIPDDDLILDSRNEPVGNPFVVSPKNQGKVVVKA
jgi:hypothetical protein